MESGLSKICLFVRNLPYSLSDAELEAVFKVHGPLKSSYTVKQRGGGQCRGFGYVTYDSSEDAQKALSQVKVIKGRPVEVAFAKRKKFVANKKQAADTAEGAGEQGSDEEEDYESLTAKHGALGKKRRPKSERGRAKFDVGRVVVLKNLPQGAKRKKLRKKCEPFGDIQEIVYPVNSDPHTAHVVFATHKNARSAVRQLDGSKYKKLSEGVMEACLLSLESKSVSSKTLKKSRLIVRNLSFKCSEEDVRKVFQKYGTVLRVDIPTKDNGLMLGYAFVQFRSYFDAARAIAGVNKTKVKGRVVTVDWLLPKAEYQSLQENGDLEGGSESEGEGEEGSEEEGSEGEEGSEEDEESEGEWAGLEEASTGSEEVSTGSEWEEEEGDSDMEGGGDESGENLSSDDSDYIRYMLGEREEGEEGSGGDRSEGEGGSQEESEDFSGHDLNQVRYKLSEEGDDSLWDSAMEMEVSKEEREEDFSSDSEPVRYKLYEEDSDMEGGLSSDSEQLQYKLFEEEEEASDMEEREGEEGSEEEDSASSSDCEQVRYKLASHADDVQEGRTLFIRNLPLTADRTELRQLMTKFGPVRYCRLMLHPDTSVPTGSAFVQFQTPSGARKCLEGANECEGGVSYDGQALTVSLALPRAELERLKVEGTEKEDKRNLYLAKEGVIFPNSYEAQEVSKQDMAKRTKAYSEKKTKLAKPHFYVSTTRLCVRNLPTNVDEKRLRQIFQTATKTPDATVVQVKILRSTERVDTSGVGRSMGYGFVEFSEHEAALSALRATNNNPKLFGKMKRPIVDFAVEDSRIMKIREKRLMKLKALQNAAASEDTPNTSQRLARRQKWQLKWQQRRQKRKESASSKQPQQEGVKRVKVQAASESQALREGGEGKREGRGEGGQGRRVGGERRREEKHLVARRRKQRHLAGGQHEEERKFAELVAKYHQKMDNSNN